MLAPDTESAILERARSSNPVEQSAATDRFVSELSQPVYKLCLHLTGNAADAEDALQDTLIAACRALPKFRGESKLSTWVYRIALRAALEVKSRRTRRSETSEDALRGHVATNVPADEQADVRQRAAKLMTAMDQLNAEQRAVISLFAVDGLQHDEIASVLGIPEGTVWSRLHLARKKLAAALA